MSATPDQTPAPKRFVIVTRHIDLAVGALLATCSAVMAMTQTLYLPELLGLPLGHPLVPWIAIAVGWTPPL